ncbi:MAG: YggS family pyridoxal phosphate-dependent enzyme [Bacteroidales bacterium]|nr:YggS family pyridoxal phosphate-dependent enzyme [Candidatus Physcousia equi]
MIQETIRSIEQELGGAARLVAVSKYHPKEAIEEAYAAGQRIFGESHVQELTAKHAVLPSDIEWHFIGHLQTNKVKALVPFVALIHAVDSERLLREIDKQAAKCQEGGRVVDVLLQLHVAQEETKYGFTTEECDALLQSGVWKELKHVRIVGLMCMASNVDDEKQIASEFATAHKFFKQVKETYFAVEESFRELSMGMSDDYPIALREGATLVRVGSKIFGQRIY